MEELIEICIPFERRKEQEFQIGMIQKREFLSHYLREFGSIAKLAYINNELRGFIQFLPKQKEQIVEIQCIFVPHKEQQHQGIGKTLLLALMKEMKQPKSYFKNKKPKALTTYAFDAHSGYPQHKFYEKFGFKRINENDEYYLYFPLEEDYQYKPRITVKNFTALPEDASKVIITIEPNCTFSYLFAKETEKIIRTVDKNIDIKFVNILTQREELEKRGGILPNCVVKGIPITAFFMEEEAFIQEVQEAMMKNVMKIKEERENKGKSS